MEIQREHLVLRFYARAVTGQTVIIVVMLVPSFVPVHNHVSAVSSVCWHVHTEQSDITCYSTEHHCHYNKLAGINWAAAVPAVVS